MENKVFDISPLLFITSRKINRGREEKFCLLCHIFIRLMKNGSNRFHAVTWYLPSITLNLEPTAIRNSGSVPVEMEGCEDVWFEKRSAVDFLMTKKKKLPPIATDCRTQAVCGLSAVRRWVWQFKEEEVEEANVCDKFDVCLTVHH